MLLRTLVENWVRQTAQEQLFQAARQTLQPGPAETAETSALPPPPCQIGIIFALGIEAGGLVDKLEGMQRHRHSDLLVEHTGWIERRRVTLVQSGVGRAAAAAATTWLLHTQRPDWIISAGFAGALVPELHRGHVLLADEVTDLENHRLPVELNVDRDSLAASPSLHVGRLVTVDELIRSQEKKRELAESSNAVACDMETHAVVATCQAAGTPCLSVRIISDGCEEELPPEIETLLDQKSLAAKFGAAAGAIFRRPSSIKDMWQLHEDALRASDRLARFLCGTIVQLAAPSQAQQIDEPPQA